MKLVQRFQISGLPGDAAELAAFIANRAIELAHDGQKPRVVASGRYVGLMVASRCPLGNGIAGDAECTICAIGCEP